MSKIDVIRQKLENSLAPIQLKILDESAHHIGHSGASPGGETHFRIEIVSSKFNGVKHIARHRMVYAALEGAFEDGLHALEIYTKASNE